jgi:carbonic anhydrase
MSHRDAPRISAEPCCHSCLSRRQLLRGAVGAVGLAVGLGSLPGPTLAADEVHWSYEGATGPENWGKLSPEFAVCGSGRSQSPVDIPPSAPLNPADLTFAYRPSALNILNNGHTVRVNYDPGSLLTLAGTTYELVQYHFHTQSEHTVGGKLADMELHLVHRGQAGNLAVVGVLMTRGDENPAYASTFANLPPTEGQPRPVPGATVNAADLLPRERTYYRYDGSLTTPPCSEGVRWLVMNNPVQVSDAQVGAFRRLFARDNRPVQPLNSRPFLVSSRVAPLQLPRTGAPGLEQLAAGAGLLAAAGMLLRARRA